MLTHVDHGNAATPPPNLGDLFPQPCPFMLLSRSPLPTSPRHSKRGYISNEKVSLKVGHKQESSV